MTTPTIFGGMGQFKTFSIGVNGGITSESLATGGTNIYNHKQLDGGFGISVREQFSYTFGLQADFHVGSVKATDLDANGNQLGYFTTKFYSPSLSGVFTIANISWLHRKDAINLFATTGGTLLYYQPKGQLPTGQLFDYSVPENIGGVRNGGSYALAFAVPVGVGLKFKITDALALNLGYTENFIDASNFDNGGAIDFQHPYSTPGHAVYAIKSHYSYGYAGLEFTIGSKSKPNLDWVNPVALMYDELYDAALRKEVEALKNRVNNVQNAINDLKKDSDGDGVSDQFDKCPNTPAGTVVDGAGCPINFPPPPSCTNCPPPVPFQTIQFEFDSFVIRTPYYAILDATSADLRSNPEKKVIVAGYASLEGTAAHNLRLSRDRANAVKRYLVNSGVSEKQLSAKGYGTAHPVANNATEEGRILNRRVEFKQ